LCLLVFAWQVDPRQRLILAANRDEFHARPAAPFAKWQDQDILAGRDLQAGGTWLGIDHERRFGVVTNFREAPGQEATGPSRGDLIPSYLSQRESPGSFLANLESAAQDYSGFNILVGDAQDLWYASNRGSVFARRLEPGIYGLSNRFLDTPWPKLTRVRRRFGAWLTDSRQLRARELLPMLEDRTPSAAGDEAYPADLPPEWRHTLSSPFVLHPVFGTRCSTALLLASSGALHVIERRFDAAGDCSGETELELNATAWP
jgi:uncharacterized protein with NRDE domain